MIMPPPAGFDERHGQSSAVAGPRFKAKRRSAGQIAKIIQYFQWIGEISAAMAALPCKIRPAPSREGLQRQGIRRDGRVA
jgi:hypothetical protein